MSVNIKIPFLDLQAAPAATKSKVQGPAADAKGSVGFGQMFSDQMKKPVAQKPRPEQEIPGAKGSRVEQRDTRKDTRPSAPRAAEDRAAARKESPERGRTEPPVRSEADTRSKTTSIDKTEPGAEEPVEQPIYADAGGQNLPPDTATLPLMPAMAGVSPAETSEGLEPTDIPQTMTQTDFLKLMQKGAPASGGLDFKPEALEEMGELALDGAALEGDNLMKMDDFGKLMSLSSKGLSLDSKFQLQNLSQALAPDDIRAPAPAAGSLLSTASRDGQSVLNQYTTSVQVPFQDAKWGEQMINKVLWLTSQNLRSAEIHLNPADLGPVDVKIQVQQDQTTTIQIQAHNPSVREALEANSARLRDALAGNGLELAQFDVSTQSGQQQSHQQQAEGSGQRQNGSELDQDPMSDVQVQETQVELPGLVNTYV